MDIAWLIGGGVAILGIAAAILIRTRWDRMTAMAAGALKAMTPSLAMRPSHEEAQQPPTQLVLAVEDEPVLALTMLSAAEASKRMHGAVRCAPSAFGRALEPLMQVAPSMATAGMAGSRQLMEVVINGPLVAAADGNGFRAMTMGANGIQQNARLFEPKALQNVANAAALWQLASVAVAQKHLADISATLKRVEDKVAGIQSMLEEERANLIKEALNYIQCANLALQKGEFLGRTRDELEHFEIALAQTGSALLQQIERESNSPLERDMIGSSGEYNSALDKHRRLSERAAELVACVDVRLGNWYLCALYPDRSRMLDGRMKHIQRFIGEVAALQVQLHTAMKTDCEKLDALFTSGSTIANRRDHVESKARPGHEALREGLQRWTDIIAQVQAVSDERGTTSRLLVETDGRTPTAVYLTRETPTLPVIDMRNEAMLACV